VTPTPRLRRLVAHASLLLAAVALAACAGGEVTGSTALHLRLQLPPQVIGTWVKPGDFLTCRPDLVVSASGEGHATFTGGSSLLSAPYGDTTNDYSAGDMTQILGAPGIDGGGDYTVTLPKAGYASFRFTLTVRYTDDATGAAGSSSVSFDCEAP
jgi:hypothetical protein